MKTLLICAGLALPGLASAQEQTNAERARIGLPPIDTVAVQWRAYPNAQTKDVKHYALHSIQPLPKKQPAALVRNGNENAIARTDEKE
jgi:hypothetical protein